MARSLRSAFTSRIGSRTAGLLATFPLVSLTKSMGTPILVDWPILATCFVAVVVTCLGAAILPTVKLMRLEPAMVFRG